MFPLHMQFNNSAREHPVTSFNQRSPCGYIHDDRSVARAHPRENDAVLLKALTSRRAPTIDWLARYGGVHMCDRTLNFRMRVRPVSPSTRMTYCESPRPRM